MSAYLVFHAGGTHVFWIFGLLAAAGSAAEYFAMALSQAPFISFGGFGAPSPVTIFFWLIPGVHLLLALFSIATAARRLRSYISRPPAPAGSPPPCP